jgi:hypothetical protein
MALRRHLFPFLRNICGREWLKDNPGGSKDAFNEYFSTLSPEQKKVPFTFLPF